MIIQVTQKHIDAGIPRRPYDCPIALALTDALLSQVSVGMYTFGNYSIFGYLPQNAQDFRAAFDSQLKMEPFEFEIEDPA